MDWTTVATGNAIQSSDWTIPSGITKVADTHTDTEATARLSGGTAGQSYRITNTVTLADGQIIPWWFQIDVEE